MNIGAVTVDDNQIVIGMPISDWAAFRPSVMERQELILPLSGALAEFRCLVDDNQVLELEPVLFDQSDRPGISTKKTRVNALDREIEIQMVWFSERQEWVILRHCKWVESACLDDEDHDGPYGLNEACARKILQAYGIPESALPLTDVAKTSPDVLRTLRPA